MQTKEPISPSLKSYEDIFKAIEEDEQLFKETTELVLSLIVSDPKWTQEVTELIASDYRVLYQSITDRIIKENDKADNTMGCCKKFQ